MKYLTSLLLVIIFFFISVFFELENVDALIMGHPLEFWDMADVILDGVVINQFNETDGLVQHDVRVEQYFKNEKPQQMITVFGPGIHSEDWFYPKVFEEGQRALFYLKKVDDKYIILEFSREATEHCDPRSMIGLSTLPGEDFVRGGKALFFDPYQTCNGYLYPAGYLRDTLSPLKQVKAGIKLGDIGCNDNLQLMYQNNNHPACVRESSVSRLLNYGWTLVDNEDQLQFRTPLPTILFEDFPKQIELGNEIDFSIEVLDIKENHERPEITITDKSGQIVWSGQHRLPDTSRGMAHSGEFRIMYHMKDHPEQIMLESGEYMVSVSLDNQSIAKKIRVGIF